MKTFFRKLFLIFLLFLFTEAVLLFVIPRDKNSTLCEYNHKLELLANTPSPRIIVVGGSSVAFGVDSKRIKDSLGLNVVNFGLHGGIGVRFMLEDYQLYSKIGDVVMMPIEYANFYNGGNGSESVWAKFMIATEWRRIGDLNLMQWYNIIQNIPKVVIDNFNRLLKYPKRKSWDSPSSGRGGFRFCKAGFNEFGDEVDHWKYPSKGIKPKGIVEEREIDHDFMVWLKNILHQFEQRGVKVLMLPPVNVTTNFL